MLLSFGVRVDYLTEVLPGILLFSLGLSITVAPMTAAILAGVDQSEAGIGSAVNNAVARVAGLIATVAVGALVAAQFSSSLDHKLAGEPLHPARACSRRTSQAADARPAFGRRRPGATKRRRSPSHRASPRSRRSASASASPARSSSSAASSALRASATPSAESAPSSAPAGSSPEPRSNAAGLHA